MYSRFQLAYKYLKYYLTASNGKGHGMHSPFVFEFITRVLNDKTDYLTYKKTEQLRKQMLNDNSIITVEDFGAGSTISKSNKRSTASIAKNAAKPEKYGQLLYRMVQYYKPASILEMGTSLGITSAYLAAGNPAARLLTLEGADEIAAKAEENFRNTGLKNIEQVKGNFDNTLPAVISKAGNFDLVFIDGNHRKVPTLNYFHQLLNCINNSSILVFDDIHWSREMEDAWQEIKSHNAVTCTLDLFFIGIVLFRKEFKEKQHFTIRF